MCEKFSHVSSVEMYRVRDSHADILQGPTLVFQERMVGNHQQC